MSAALDWIWFAFGYSFDRNRIDQIER